MEKERLVKLANCLEEAGFKIAALKERDFGMNYARILEFEAQGIILPTGWVVEIIPIRRETAGD